MGRPTALGRGAPSTLGLVYPTRRLAHGAGSPVPCPRQGTVGLYFSIMGVSIVPPGTPPFSYPPSPGLWTSPYAGAYNQTDYPRLSGVSP